MTKPLTVEQLADIRRSAEYERETEQGDFEAGARHEPLYPTPARRQLMLLDEIERLGGELERALTQAEQHRAAVQRVRHLIAHPYGAERHVPGYVNAADLLAAIEPKEQR